MSQHQSPAGAKGFLSGFQHLRGFVLNLAGRATRALALSLAALVGSVCVAEAEDRTLKLYFGHTGERATITYKRDGRFDRKGMAQINHILRDWRRNKSTTMDPRLIDLVWEIYQRTGSDNYIHVVSGYRSPATNNMLRGRSRATGVAKQSQHMLGRAMDFFIPGVKLSSLRAIAMQAQGGGVGYYPTSGSPFVHVDVGNVRAWPRMSRQELARLFPNGRTIHLPADGRPMPGYAVALAEHKRRGGASLSFAGSVAVASAASNDDEDDAPIPGLPERRAVVTAMLPVPKGRPQEALEIITDPLKSAPAGAKPVTGEAGFTDLAALSSVPAPGLRPKTTAAPDMIQTASIDPAVPTMRPPDPVATARVQKTAAFTTGLAPVGTGRVLKAPITGSIATLPITGPDLDVEDEFDAQDTLIAWAVSSPGTPAGMTAPVIIGRTLTDLTAEPQSSAPLPPAITEDFDHDRFWGKG